MVDLGLREMIGSFSEDRVQEINATKSPGDKREYVLPMEVYLRSSSSVREDIRKAHLSEGQFGVVGVRSEVFDAVEALA